MWSSLVKSQVKRSPFTAVMLCRNSITTNHPCTASSGSKNKLFPSKPKGGLPKERALIKRLSRQLGKTSNLSRKTIIKFRQKVTRERCSKILATTCHVPSITAAVIATLIKSYLARVFQKTSFSRGCL